MILLDTSVLVYAVGSEHPLRDPCRLLVERLAKRSHAATTTEVIQEFAHVYSRRRPRARAAELARQYASALELWPVSADDLTLGLDLYERHESLGAFDSVLAAVGLNHNVVSLVSTDTAFGEVASLPWAHPESTELVEYCTQL